MKSSLWTCPLVWYTGRRFEDPRERTNVMKPLSIATRRAWSRIQAGWIGLAWTALALGGALAQSPPAGDAPSTTVATMAADLATTGSAGIGAPEMQPTPQLEPGRAVPEVLKPKPADQPAATTGTLRLLSTMETYHKNVRTIHAVFDQVRIDEVFDETIESRGELWFDKPDRFRCDYADPNKMINLIVDDSLFIYTPELNQVDYWKFESPEERDLQLHQLLIGFGIDVDQLLHLYEIHSSEDEAGPLEELAREGLVECRPGPRGTIVIRDEPSESAKPTTLACLLRPHRPRNEADNFAVDMIQGVRDEISAHHYRFVYHCLDEDDYEQRMLRLARERWVCGVLADQRTPIGLIRELVDMGLPVTTINRQVPVAGVSCAVPDYERLARESVRMFVEKGYERIGFASIMTEEIRWDQTLKDANYPSESMRRGLRAAATARGMAEKDLVWIVERSGPVQPTPEFFGLPRRKPKDWRPLGVFVDIDRRAVSLLEAIRQTDLVLGTDIGVIGCYDLEIDRHTELPPSTWRIDPLAVGAAAVAQLISCIENGDTTPAVVKIPAEFVDRGTA